ncbi:MAG: MarR family transcriptional regulator [Arachnia sp.]
MAQAANDLIGYRLKHTQSVLRARMDDTLRPLGLTTPQYSSLDAIGRHPGASNSEIARRVFVTRQTMNTLLRGLQEKGLIERATSPEVGRALPVQLTPEGRRVLSEATELIAAIEQTMVDALGPDQRSAFLDALRVCADALERSL